MQIMTIIPTIISVISVCLSGLVYMNSRKAIENTKIALNNTKETLKQSQDKYLYELRLDALKATKKVESAWQLLINDVYHEKERINEIKDNLTKEIDGMFNDVELGLLKPSLENIFKVRNNLEKNFDSINEEDAKIAIRTMEVIDIGLKQVQEESRRKYQLLYNKLKNRNPSL